MEKERIVRFVLIGVILVCAMLFVFENVTIHGRATGGDVVSNVSIFLSLAIDFSPELSNGIVFEDVLILPVTDLNAVGNYNGTNNSTNYYVLVSPDGNTPVDLCVNVNSPLMTDSMDVIGVQNQSYSHSQFSNLSLPNLSGEIPFSLNFQDAGYEIPVGGRGYFRFWLDIPSGQSPGEYNNSVTFRALPTGLEC